MNIFTEQLGIRPKPRVVSSNVAKDFNVFLKELHFLMDLHVT